MKLLHVALIIACIVTSGTHTFSQVVNIETARMHTDSTGMLGDIYADVSVSKNSNEVFSIDLNSHLQYKTKKDLFLLVGSYGFLKISGENIIDNTFFHFRYNRKLNKWLRWEAFTQLQKNVINGIESRYLIGTGPRNKLLERKNIKIYLASLVMYEHEIEADEARLTHRDIRSSSYVSLTLFPYSNFEIATTTFFQPLFKSIEDYRVLNQVRVKVKAGKHFGITLNWSYLYDSKPAYTIPSVSYTLTTGLGYDF